MTFAEAAMIMMSDSGKTPVIQSLTITANGTYSAPEGVDGYSPIDVKVPDRYQDGYTDGFSEGYNEGKTEGAAEQKKICDEEKAVLIKEIAEQGKEIEKLKENQGYTFPEGTSYEDIYQFVSDDTVTDKTSGITIRTIVVDDSDGRSITVGIYNSNGKLIDYIAGGGFGGKYGRQTAIVESVFVNSATGKYDVTISWDDWNAGTESIEHYIEHHTGTHSRLVGFGSSEHQIHVENN